MTYNIPGLERDLRATKANIAHFSKNRKKRKQHPIKQWLATLRRWRDRIEEALRCEPS